jgi:cytochrome c oxidase subunit 2
MPRIVEISKLQPPQSRLWGMLAPLSIMGVALHGGPAGVRAELFQRIYEVFLLLGTAVGVVVVGYMLLTAYRYRDGAGNGGLDDPPRLGETPTGSGGGGRKLALSFTMSAIIVVSLVGWTYGFLADVEGGPPEGEDPLEVHVVGYQWGWEFQYPNGHTTTGDLRVPAGRPVELTFTSEDVHHTFGAPDLRVKADAIPGQTTETWLDTSQVGTYEARCFELCGIGHSSMTAEIHVLPRAEFQTWYANTTNGSQEANGTTDGGNAVADGTDQGSENLPSEAGKTRTIEFAARTYE